MGCRNIIMRVCCVAIIMINAMLFSLDVNAKNSSSNIYMTVGSNAKLPKEVRYKGYAYKTSNNKLLQVSDKGELHAGKKGNVYVTAIYSNGRKTKKKKYTIKIHDKVKKLKWIDKTEEIILGDQYKCAISYKVKSKKNVSFKWESSDKNIAVVDNKGIVKGISTGDAIISCTVKGQKKATISFNIHIKEKPVQTFKLDNDNNTRKLFEVSNVHNGDAKFFGDKIITGVNGKLNIFGLNGNLIKTYDELKTNWLDSYFDDRLIIYGNFNKEIGIVSLDTNYNIITNNTIMKSENLLIDPTINKIDDRYYITVTEIKGTVNNSDELIENGEYWIHLYVSDDLVSWQYITDIEHMKNNLEDIDIMCFDDVMYAVYEVETHDKGASAIIMRSSYDKGKTWSDSIALLEADCDHEPVGIYRDSDKYILCYSCDKDDVGKSYMGGRAYYSVYDKNWNCIKKDIKIATECEKGILWYDYMLLNDKEYFLFSKDYFTTCDMVVEFR